MRNGITKVMFLGLAAILLIALACSSPAPTATPVPAAKPQPTAAPSAPKFAKMELVATHVHTPDSAPHFWLVELDKLLKEATGGQVTIKHYEDKELYKDHVQAALAAIAGDIDIAISTQSTFAQVGVPETAIYAVTGLFGLPGGRTTGYDFDANPNGGGVLKEKLLAKGVKHLGVVYINDVYIFFKQKYATLASMSGVKVRTPGSKSYNDGLKAMGMVGAPIAIGELFQALQTGIVDGAITARDGAVDASLQNVAKWRLDLPLWYSTTDVVMSAKKWDSWSPELRKVIEQSASKATVYSRDLHKNQIVKKYQDILAAAGVQAYDLSAEDNAAIVAKFDSVWQEAKKDYGNIVDVAIDIRKKAQ